MPEVELENTRNGMEIAVIGLAGRFPGAKNIDEFWENLKNGVESISFFTDNELQDAGIRIERIQLPGYVKAKGALENLEVFDAGFFDYTAKEAEVMDPQLRILHECCWGALEHAGYNPWSYRGLIGLYTGSSYNYRWLSQFMPRVISDQVEENELFEISTLNMNSSFCTRISYKLNLTGPSIFVQTACSTSLVSIHLACQGILAGECNIALAGGVAVTVPAKAGYFYQEGMIHSKHGHVRTFDSKADGTVFGNGVGIVVLKALEDAIADGDTIYAMVKGSAVNNDGFRKVGFTAPGTQGQSVVITRALQAAEVEPESISYIEAHGTGTTLGDPIETESLTQAFKTEKTGFCRIGSVKSNIGHLDVAAGVSGFIKTVLALKHRMIPPSLHFEKSNSEIDFENSPFIVNTGLMEWRSDKAPLRAGVSSFGIGGTNAHVVLEEAPQTSSGPSRRYQLFLLSARTEAVLEQMTENLGKYFKDNPQFNRADAAYTLQVGRKAFEWRRAWVYPNPITETMNTPDLLIHNATQLQTCFIPPKKENRPVIFMFPGQGAQYVNMGRDLYNTEPEFRNQMDRCFELLNPLLGYSIKDLLFPTDTDSNIRITEKRSNENIAGAQSEAEFRQLISGINLTEVAQPLLFIFEYALARLLIKWGIRPYAMIGHSIGEYTAACIAGVISLENAIEIVALRGKLMQQLPGGSMLSLSMSREQVIPFLSKDISLAAINSPEICVVSGTVDAIDQLIKQLPEDVQYRSLHTSHAFHSAMMEPVLKDFSEKIEQFKFKKPIIPYLSNLTGHWITDENLQDNNYWAKHLRDTVRFSEGIQELINDDEYVFYEVGPGKTLSTFVKHHNSNLLVLNLIRHPNEENTDDYYLMNKMGQSWLYGASIDWKKLYTQEKRLRIPLPTYPFCGQYYWNSEQIGSSPKIETVNSLTENYSSTGSESLKLHKRPGLSSVFVSPNTEIEKALVKMWQYFFRVEQLGIDDDFFELGGDSLKISIVRSKIHKTFNADIPVPEFFKRPTIRRLATFISSQINKDIYSSIVPVENKEYYSITSAQKMLIILNELDNKTGTGYNQPSFLKLHGQLDKEKFETIFNTLIRRHESLRTSFHIINGVPVQRIHQNITVAIEYHKVNDNEESHKIEEITNNFVRAFDFKVAPLFRIGLITVSHQEHILMMDLHHIIADGTSLGLFFSEFISLYEKKELPESKVQYRDFAEWVNCTKMVEIIRYQEAFWLEQFADEIPILNLPIDYTRPEVQRYEGEKIRFDLPAEETEALKKIAHDEGATLFMILFAIITVFLSKLCGQEDIVVGTPSASRNHSDLDKIVGMFVNTLALRHVLQPDQTFLEYFIQLRINTLKAFENQDYPFDQLVEKLNIPRDSSRNPLFDVLFTMQNLQYTWEQETILVSPEDGNILEVSGYPVENNTSKFDFSIDVAEKETLKIIFEYNVQLFKRETIEQFVTYFKKIVSIVINDTDIKLIDLRISDDYVDLISDTDETESDEFGF